jgi:two-component system chemotaxis sensor kinase CheA
VEGEDVELDKSIIEALADPLTHLVRNAADHGIEKPEIREKLGKRRVGTITLKAYHESGYVNVDIMDDGRGIDRNVIKSKALEKGIIEKEELDNMTNHDVLSLILRPGFSTLEEVTDVSGRGVGMDVVNTNVGKMGGVVDIYTNVGEGSVFRLILPLTLAIIPSLIVGVEKQKFALPQANLKEIIRIKPNEVKNKLQNINNSFVLKLRENIISVVKLSTILGIKEEEQDKILRVLVLKTATKIFGLVVDVIYDEEEILVKPIPSYFKESKSYSGATIMGDGKIAMILDVEGILEKANLKFYDYEDININNDNKAVVCDKQILRFKCSGPEILGIDISSLKRVDKIKSSDIEKIGIKEYVKIKGKVLKLIRPEKILKVSSSCNYKEELFVLIPEGVHSSVGVLIEDIMDTINISDDLKQKSNILLVDINKLIETAIEQGM